MSQASECTHLPNSSTSKLACLNNCLASYVEEVHKLKNENLRYSSEVEALKQQLEDYNCDGIRERFEAKWSQACSRTEEAEKDKAKYQLVAEKNTSRIGELENEVKELKKELKATKSRANAAERSAASANLQRKATEAEKASLEHEVNKMSIEIKQLHVSVEELRNQLEQEVVRKVEFETRSKFLSEELSFRKTTYESEMEKLQTEVRVSCLFPEPDDIQAVIDEIRKANAMDLASYRTTLEKKHKKKLSSLESQNTDLSTTIAQLNMEVKKLRSDCGKKEEIAILRKNIERLESLLRSKEMDLDSTTQRHSIDMACKEEELCELQERYEALMDLKLKMDQEIMIYRNLLLKEESNLNIKLTCHGTKRPREETTAVPPPKKPCAETPLAGCIQISEVDPTGCFIEIKNLSASSKHIGGYRIVHEVEGKKGLAYAFHHSFKLQAKTSVKVWGSKADGSVLKNSATDKIFRDTPTWGASHNAVTKLITAKAEVVATYIQTNEPSSVQSPDSPDSPVMPEPPPAEASGSLELIEDSEGEEVMQDENMGEEKQGGNNTCVIS